jgi:hypothetical protein
MAAAFSTYCLNYIFLWSGILQAILGDHPVDRLLGVHTTRRARRSYIKKWQPTFLPESLVSLYPFDCIFISLWMPQAHPPYYQDKCRKKIISPTPIIVLLAVHSSTYVWRDILSEMTPNIDAHKCRQSFSEGGIARNGGWMMKSHLLAQK